MSNDITQVPAGSGKHPVVMVAISANALNASAMFYSKLFGWQTHVVSQEIVGAMAPAGPGVSLRANTPSGFPGLVPFIRVDDVDAALRRVVAAGSTIERAPWTVPMAGTLARFADPSGTIYGLIGAVLPGEVPRMPMPFGSNPKPPIGTVCSLEMYAPSGVEAAAFFGKQFGWGALETMPQYMAFDPGAGVPGVFQSHTASLPAVAYIYVADVAAKLAEIDAARGHRIGGAMAIPGMGTFGYFKDPSGTTMGLIGP
jgi:hypothetical protein